ncbi:MAG TPA: HupE/UreJ family protein, partial [Gammaproteobacteria bacterium]|nr:HupE/UreJ family protein [Gammaproteobacteria bacterium]
PEMSIDVAGLLAQWGKKLSPGFMGDDPNQKLKVDKSGTPVASPIPASPQGREPAVDDSSFFSRLNPAFFRLGVEHILSGYDHILFVVALLLIPATLSRVAGLITAFTVAHSITLGLSVFNVVTLPPAITEPLIVLSIIYVALGDWRLLAPEGSGANWVTSLSSQKSHRWMVTFGFGLIHGFGFSYILREMGLGNDRASALLLFNLGVEAGQMMIVLPLYPLLHYVIFRQNWGRQATRSAALVITLLAGFWLLERLGLIA